MPKIARRHGPTDPQQFTATDVLKWTSDSVRGLAGRFAVETLMTTFYTADGRPLSVARDKALLCDTANALLCDERTRTMRQLRRKLQAQKRDERIEFFRRSLAKAKAPKARGDQGVYVIGKPGGEIKIGITCDIRGRLSSLQTSSPDKLRLYLFLESPAVPAREVEKECHRRLSSFRKSGEWFDMDWRDAVEMVRKVAAA